MTRTLTRLLMLVGIMDSFGSQATSRAAIVTTGDVVPTTDPTTWTNSTTAYIGNTSNGSLTVNSGDNLFSRGGYIGYEAASTGEVTVTGTDATWTNSQNLCVGDRGTGILNISGGGTVKCINSFYPSSIGASPDSTGTVTVNGIGSRWINSSTVYIGDSGSGTLTISGGGAVSNSWAHIGRNAGSMGVVTVDGAESTWTSDVLEVGLAGSGKLNVIGGGTVNSSYGFIGDNTGSTGMATVDGSNSTWTNSGAICVGAWGSGTLTISSGGTVTSSYGSIGAAAGSTGVVTVTGNGSTWSNRWGTDLPNLYVGRSGNGTLNISDGGVVTVAATTYVAAEGGTGTINFGTGGGTLHTKSLAASPSQLAGTGTIITRGLISDIELRFDATHGLTQTLMFDSHPGQDVTVNLDMIGPSTNNGDLGAGYQGNGALAIRDGITVNAYNGYIGFKTGSTGAVTVDGAGSTWNLGNLQVGCNGSGSLNVASGGTVSSAFCFIGFGQGSEGTVAVDGIGSTWTGRATIQVGNYGNGTLSITGGGAISSGAGYVGYYSGSKGTVTVDGAGSTWTNGGLYVGYSGIGTFTQAGGTNTVAGTLSLGSNSTGQGTYTLQGGLLEVQGLSKGSGIATFNFDGGTLRAGVAFSSTLPMILTGTNGIATVDTQSYVVTLYGVLSGAGGLTKEGSGTLSLRGSNSYAGTTNIAAGILNLGIAQNGTASGPMGASGTIALDGGTLQYSGSNQFDYSNRFSTAASQYYNVDTNGQNVIWAAALTSLGGSLTKSGNGTLTLTAPNTYTGVTTVNAGTLSYGTSNALSTGAVTINGGTLSLGVYSDSVGDVTLASGAITSSAGTLTSTSGFTVSSGSVSAVLAGNVPLTKTGSGTVTLSRANTYTGVTTVNAGTLSYGTSNALSTGAVTINGGTLSLGVYNDSVGDVTLNSGAITSSAGTLTSTSGFMVSSGSVSAVLAGNVPLTKTGSGTVALSRGNTYTGVTTVYGGTLNVTGTLANNGSDKVSIYADATGTAKLVRRVLGAGLPSYAGVGSTVAVSQLNTQADIVAGVATGTCDVTMAWRTRNDVPGGDRLISEVLILDGIHTKGSGTDTFLLKLSYDPAMWGLVEEDPIVKQSLYLATLLDSQWVRAVDRNSGCAPAWQGDMPVSSVAAGDLTAKLGWYGVDTTTHVAWAVVDHNSCFAVVPEPSAIVLLVIGIISLLARTTRWQRRQAEGTGNRSSCLVKAASQIRPALRGRPNPRPLGVVD